MLSRMEKRLKMFAGVRDDCFLQCHRSIKLTPVIQVV